MSLYHLEFIKGLEDNSFLIIQHTIFIIDYYNCCHYYR